MLKSMEVANRIFRLTGKATIHSQSFASRKTKVLMSLKHYLPAQNQRHQSISRREEMSKLQGLKKLTIDHTHWVTQPLPTTPTLQLSAWQINTAEISERLERIILVFPYRVDL